jgi:predicted transcriptional regulator of viral defense system
MDDIKRPDHRALRRIAYSQDGLFTARQAREAGISRQLLARHLRNGRYERVAQGLYRLCDFPTGSHEEVRARWLVVGQDRAVVSHESALELHGLSDVLPDRVHFLVDRHDRWVRPPSGVVLHTSRNPLREDEVVTREGIRVTAPLRSILDAASSGAAPEQVHMAVRQAVTDGIVTTAPLISQAQRRGRRVARLIRGAVQDAAT